MKKVVGMIGFFYCAVSNAGLIAEEKSDDSKNVTVKLVRTEENDKRPLLKPVSPVMNNEIIQKTFQADSLPVVGETVKKNRERKMVPSTVVPEQNHIELSVYPNNYCMIVDRRILRVKRGINKVRFEDIIPCDHKSITLRTPNRGKITVQHYHYNAPIKNFDELLRKSTGEKVSYNEEDTALMHCIAQAGTQMVIVDGDKNSCVVLPSTEVRKISGETIRSMNSLDVVFESKNSEDVEVELCYIVPAITQGHAYDVDVFEKLDRVDVCSKCVINNATPISIKNASVVVKQEVFADNGGGINIIGSKHEVRLPNVDLPKHAETVCAFYHKNMKHSVTYRVKISQDDLEFSHQDAQGKFLVVNNLITLENMGQHVVRSKDFENSSVNVYYRQGDSRDFCGRFKLSSMQKYGNDWKLEIGEAGDVTARYQRTDRNNSVKNQCDYGFKISLQNNKAEDVSVNFVVDMDLGKYKILRSNLEQNNGEWMIPLKANESKELQVRIRVNKQ